MSSTSQKHRNFVAEPMGEKPVTDLAGIGDVLGGRLSDLGYDKVSLFICFVNNGHVFCCLVIFQCRRLRFTDGEISWVCGWVTVFSLK